MFVWKKSVSATLVQIQWGGTWKIRFCQFATFWRPSIKSVPICRLHNENNNLLARTDLLTKQQNVDLFLIKVFVAFNNRHICQIKSHSTMIWVAFTNLITTFTKITISDHPWMLSAYSVRVQTTGGHQVGTEWWLSDSIQKPIHKGYVNLIIPTKKVVAFCGRETHCLLHPIFWFIIQTALCVLK